MLKISSSLSFIVLLLQLGFTLEKNTNYKAPLPGTAIYLSLTQNWLDMRLMNTIYLLMRHLYVVVLLTIATMILTTFDYIQVRTIVKILHQRC